MPATLLDIARETNTSVSTVSRVLAGGAVAQRISRETRGKVLAAAHRLGYRPNLLARSLRTRKSHTVALLVSDVGNPFFAQIGSRIEQSLHRHGYSLVLCNSGENVQREEEYLEMLPRKGIDGLIVVPVASTRATLEEHFGPGVPIVVLDREIPGMSCAVASNQQQGATILADALQKRGVKTVAIVSGPESLSTHRERARAIAERFEVIARHEGHAAQTETGRAAFKKFHEMRPDAVVCTNSFVALGYMEAIESPDEPIVVGSFDEIPMMHLLPLPIATSVQDMAGLAEGCVTQLLPQLRGESDFHPQPMALPMKLVTNPAFDAGKR